MRRKLLDVEEERDRLRRELISERRRSLDLATKDRFHRLAHEMTEGGVFGSMSAFYKWVRRYLDKTEDQVHARFITAEELDSLSETARRMLRNPEKRADCEGM